MGRPIDEWAVLTYGSEHLHGISTLAEVMEVHVSPAGGATRGGTNRLYKFICLWLFSPARECTNDIPPEAGSWLASRITKCGNLVKVHAISKYINVDEHKSHST